MQTAEKNNSQPDYEDMRAIQTADAVDGLIREANESHEAFMQAGEAMGAAIIRAANAGRRVGLCLIALKEQARDGEWLNLFSSSVRGGKRRNNPGCSLHFSDTMARRYMAVARTLTEPVHTIPDGVRTLKELLIVCGALPEPERGQQSDRGQLGSDALAESRLMGFWGILGKEVEKADVRQWPQERREHWKERLKPIAELYATL